MVKTTDDIDITEEEMMEFARSVALPQKKPGELTSKVFAEQAKLSRRWAYDQLNSLEAKGLVRSYFVYEDQHRVRVFVPVKGSWKELLSSIT